VIAVTAFFLIVASVLAILITLAVRDMTMSATAIDDARALHAATAAVRALEARLSATLRDNSVWDDGYKQIISDKAKDFADTTWGKSTDDNPLFDLSVVMTPQHQVLSSYKKGVEFDPHSFLGPSLLAIVAEAEKSGRMPAVSFMQTPDGLALVAAGGIQPYANSGDNLGPFNTLVFAKFLSADALQQIEETFDLNDLRLAVSPSEELLDIPLAGADGATLAYLQWPSRNPGAMIYARAHWYLMVAAVVLATFLAGILVTGVLAVRMLQRSADQARYRATHDALSGLLNRAGILGELDRSIAARRAKLKLHLIDLDGFKGVNDAWGHAVGDELIKLVAQRVKDRLPDDALFARLGGDEFAAVTGLNADPDLAQSITVCLAEPFFIGGRTIEIGASIGTVTSLNDAEDALELLRRADMALYTAKENGRGRVVTYTADLEHDREITAELEEKLRRAIANGEIAVAYQPLVDAKAGRLCGVEALAKWAPATGPVSPEIFIPIAERSGLIDQLGMQVLKAAIDQAKQWDGIALSVNVSPIQLRNPNFAAEVIAVLKAKKFDARRLTLEITEGVLMSNPEQARRAIEILRNVGVKFALDDFGCGYASIGALRTFGFDRMKIDRSLVNAIDNKGGADVLIATISLAHALNIPVTAEGVETQAQADALTLSGCDQLQGYLIGRPMTADDLTAIFASTAA
jgi:diguanylate cyclase (GGDEF)-like protein